MIALFLLVLYSTSCGVHSEGQHVHIEPLTDNVLVLKVLSGVDNKVYVPLTCGAAYQTQSVFWKKDGMELDPPLQGNQVRVLVEQMDGGNYTCHLGPDGQYLNHTVILVQMDSDNRSLILEEMSPTEGHIHCSAPNYKGDFHCTWKRTQYRSHAAVLLVKAIRNFEQIPCQLDADGSGVHCQDVNCPFREEQLRIYLTVYIHSFSRLEVYTKVFYLREIVKPSKLSNLHLSDGNVFSWNYPDSWETPRTYFALQFQVKVINHGHPCNTEENVALHNITEDTTYKVDVQRKRYIFCVRAQDKYTNGPWSHWTHCTVNRNKVQC
ncbi:interleukin-12 subunit beta [Cynoglossus semilaevis]|uniref:interleukin-12 subunit beta n=1 Tax=Cynoglossus semilaevis TaxID=244447 RepID=UPI000D629405|nr:interleukin-12 subunit beta-like [Cynoglossus semilaevis]